MFDFIMCDVLASKQSAFYEWYEAEDMIMCWHVYMPAFAGDDGGCMAAEDAVLIERLCQEKLPGSVREALNEMLPRGWFLAYGEPVEGIEQRCEIKMALHYVKDTGFGSWCRNSMLPRVREMLAPRVCEKAEKGGGAYADEYQGVEWIREGSCRGWQKDEDDHFNVPEHIVGQLYEELREGYLVFYDVPWKKKAICLHTAAPRRSLMRRFAHRLWFAEDWLDMFKEGGEGAHWGARYEGCEAGQGLREETITALQKNMPGGWIVIFPNPRREAKAEKRLWVEYYCPVKSILQKYVNAIKVWGERIEAGERCVRAAPTVLSGQRLLRARKMT